jgi:phospholipid-transporting ATPase
MITVISTTNGTPVIYLPLSVILCVSALKDLLEDLKRRADDKRENFDKTFKLTDNGFQETHWKDLRVGDIIKVSIRVISRCYNMTV